MTDLVLPATRYARSGEINIAYQVVGDGPIDLIIVPGSISHVEMVHELPAVSGNVQRLARFARVITFDKRGQGLSDRVSGVPSLEERMDDVRAVMDAVGSRKTVLMGLSEGSDMSAEIGKSRACWFLVSSGGISSAHNFPALISCLPIRIAVTVRRRGIKSLRRYSLRSGCGAGSC
jgi:pimeloyl-ACP methyl ester carboxylesterase